MSPQRPLGQGSAGAPLDWSCSRSGMSIPGRLEPSAAVQKHSLCVDQLGGGCSVCPDPSPVQTKAWADGGCFKVHPWRVHSSWCEQKPFIAASPLNFHLSRMPLFSSHDTDKLFAQALLFSSNWLENIRIGLSFQLGGISKS